MDESINTIQKRQVNWRIRANLVDQAEGEARKLGIGQYATDFVNYLLTQYFNGKTIRKRD